MLSGETDNRRRLSCRAYNKNIPGSTIEDHWDILVMCEYNQCILSVLLPSYKQNSHTQFCRVRTRVLLECIVSTLHSCSCFR